jgi:ATP-binding cassette subfamily F protein 3
MPKAAEATTAAPAPPAPKPHRTRVNPHKLTQAETLVATLESGIAGIDAQLADPAFHDGPEAAARASEASQRRAALVAELAEAEMALLALYEAS